MIPLLEKLPTSSAPPKVPKLAGAIVSIKTIAAGITADRQPCINVAGIALHNLRGCAQGWLPRDDVAGDRIENEAGRRSIAAGRSDVEITTGVGDHSGRQSAANGDGLQVGIQSERTTRDIPPK